MTDEGKGTIVVAGLPMNTNYGDVAIFQCCKMLVVDCLGKSDQVIVGLDLQAKEIQHARRPFLWRKVIGLIRRLGSVIEKEPGYWQRRSLAKYYISQTAGAKAIVVAGGGLVKYSYQRFWIYLDSLIVAAEHWGIPIVFNAVGVEGYAENDSKCQVLKKALNKSSVKAITTRDDLETLQRNYLTEESKIFCSRVADPAVWAAEAYGVVRDSTNDVVGVGLVRGGIFRDNGIDLAPKDVAALYMGMLRELDARGIRWKLFTTGVAEDLQLARQLIGNVSGIQSMDQVAVPANTRELMQIIAGFSGVIAARLHANILSYSLGVPSIGLVWNDKLPFFGECIGCPNRFIRYEQFGHPELIISRLRDAMIENYDTAARNIYRETARSGMQKSLAVAGLVGS